MQGEIRLEYNPVQEENDQEFLPEDIERALFMSVPKRLRKLSSLEFYHNAVQIRAAVIELTQSNAIPKSLRGTFSNPMCNTAREMVDKIVQGDCYYPSSEENVAKRKQCYAEAVGCVYQLCEDMQTLAAHQKQYSITKVKISKLCKIAAMCNKEIELLKAARKNTVLRNKKI